jgi:hypothetical protein
MVIEAFDDMRERWSFQTPERKKLVLAVITDDIRRVTNIGNRRAGRVFEPEPDPDTVPPISVLSAGRLFPSERFTQPGVYEAGDEDE